MKRRWPPLVPVEAAAEWAGPSRRGESVGVPRFPRFSATLAAVSARALGLRIRSGPSALLCLHGFEVELSAWDVHARDADLEFGADAEDASLLASHEGPPPPVEMGGVVGEA